MVLRLGLVVRQRVKSLSLLSLPLSPDMDAYSGPQELSWGLRAELVSMDRAWLCGSQWTARLIPDGCRWMTAHSLCCRGVMLSPRRAVNEQ
jgi:hypothetical protein